MIFGVSWIFESGRMGDWQAGYITPPSDWPLADAVAASSCFPPLFPPLPLNLPPSAYRGGAYRGANRYDLLRRLSLTDGGVYDNLGLEPVWKRHAVILVSDGGGRFGFEWKSNPWNRLLSYSTIMQNQIGALRVRWLQANLASGLFQGAYWGLATPTAAGRAPEASYSQSLVHQRIGTVRTDLNAFTEAEICVLENQGYLQAAHAIRIANITPLPPSLDLNVPHREWMDEKRVFNALRDSYARFSLRHLYQRLFTRC
jgi:NTE family protein